MSSYKGSRIGVKSLVMLYKLAGYRSVKVFVFTVSVFYALSSRSKIVPKLQTYYELISLKPSFWTYLRHVYAFSLTIFDRILSDVDGFLEQTKRTQINKEHMQHIGKVGGFVFISHFGNNMQGFKIFDTFDMKINLVVDERASEAITDIEAKKYQNSRLNKINLADGIAAMLEINEAIKRKEAVIMAVDRVVDIKHSYQIDFLGKNALFNSTPFKIAKKLRAPFVGLNVIRSADQELIIDISDIFQTDKDSSVDDMISSYVSSLERCVRRYPLQWFNFYDFWSTDEINRVQ